MWLVCITAMILMEILLSTSRRYMILQEDLRMLRSENTKGLRRDVAEQYFLMALDIIAAVSLLLITALSLTLI
jgi:hypothetical protein